LETFDDAALTSTGLHMMQRHSWYLSPELAMFSLFSNLIINDEKAQIVHNMATERGSHLLKSLPKTISELRGSRAFFLTTGIDDSFLDIPVDNWQFTQSFKEAAAMINHIVCINDCAKRGVALMQTFNATTKDEEQLQYVLQVVEQHRETFPKCDRDYLANM